MADVIHIHLRARLRGRGEESPEYAALPEWFLHACWQYVENKTLIDEPFFAALLTADVKALVVHADPGSQRSLFLMLKYLYNHVPSLCWGSEAAVGSWLRGQPEEETTDD